MQNNDSSVQTPFQTLEKKLNIRNSYFGQIKFIEQKQIDNQKNSSQSQETVSQQSRQIHRNIINIILAQIEASIQLQSLTPEFSLCTTLSILINNPLIFSKHPPCSMSQNQFLLDPQPKSTILQEGILGQSREKYQSRYKKSVNSQTSITKQKVSKNWKKIQSFLLSKFSKERNSSNKILPPITKKNFAEYKLKQQQQKLNKEGFGNMKNLNKKDLQPELISLGMQQDTEDHFIKYLRYVKGEGSKFISLNNSFEDQNNMLIGSEYKANYKRRQSSLTTNPYEIIRSSKSKKTIVLGNFLLNKNAQQQQKSAKKKKTKVLIMPYESCFYVNQGNLSINSYSYNKDQSLLAKQNILTYKTPNINQKIEKQKLTQIKKQLYQLSDLLPKNTKNQNKQNWKLPSIILKRQFKQQQLNKSEFQIWELNKNGNKKQQIQLSKFYQSNLIQPTVIIKTQKIKKSVLNNDILSLSNISLNNKSKQIQVKNTQKIKKQLKKQRLIKNDRRFS